MELCRVCGWPANGRHFGDVLSCRACVAFFRRGIQNGHAYRCETGKNNCEMRKAVRYSCKACRFARCYKSGMRGDSIPLLSKATDEENPAPHSTRPLVKRKPKKKTENMGSEQEQPRDSFPSMKEIAIPIPVFVWVSPDLSQVADETREQILRELHSDCLKIEADGRKAAVRMSTLIFLLLDLHQIVKLMEESVTIRRLFSSQSAAQ
ncbi:hypothetical protein M3Y99_01016000 [Aphelenchoides fujianensis]|nr:hypothetical protein M3Y99_01016000 [Aphelenchoides fujianensis]